MMKIRPKEHVRDDAGHSSSDITDKYIDIELRERHRSAKKTASLNINSLTDSTFLPLLQLDPKLIKTKN